MNIILWIIQGVLAAMFAMAGISKSSQSKEKLMKSGLSWVERFNLSKIRFIGASEFLGAIGLIVPLMFNIVPVLTPIAAIALATIMVLAAFHHHKHNEKKAIVFNAVLFLLATFVAYGRL
jgi:uncharacterized membrane protein YphA (DoxX/SURF4 family)